MSSIEFGSRVGFDNKIGTNISREISGVGETAETQESGATFGDFLQKMVHDTNEAHLDADRKVQEVAAGRTKDLHGAVLSMEKAEIQFHLLSQVRNKVIEAYREIMRMQV